MPKFDPIGSFISQADKIYGQALDGCLWPAEYAEKTAECCKRFLYEIRTYNEATQQIMHIEQKDYLDAFAEKWVECWLEGKPFVIEKCRRMLISWAGRSCELWAMGLGRLKHHMANETYGEAAKHVWRLEFIYHDLRRRHPEWGLEANGRRAFQGEQSLAQFSLSNGSISEAINSGSAASQGEGVGIITLEELGKYTSPSAVYTQAKLVTMAQAGAVGGFVCAITNTNLNEEWQKIKNARQ